MQGQRVNLVDGVLLRELGSPFTARKVETEKSDSWKASMLGPCSAAGIVGHFVGEFIIRNGEFERGSTGLS